MTIEERIQELRKSKGLSQEQLADILSVSRQAVSKWESGQSLPEIEKLIAMSKLFGVTVDYILKGGLAQIQKSDSRALRLGSQVVSAVAAMMLGIGLISAVQTMNIYDGFIIQITGVMILVVGWFLAGGRAASKALFTVNILLAGVLPSSLISQLLLGLKLAPLPPLALLPVLLFAGIYVLICGSILYFALIRKKT